MSAVRLTALLTRGVGGAWGERRAAGENSLLRIHLGFSCMFVKSACARVRARVGGVTERDHTPSIQPKAAGQTQITDVTVDWREECASVSRPAPASPYGDVSTRQIITSLERPGEERAYIFGN